MDNFEEIQEEQKQLMVTEEMRSHFYEMTKWTRFLGVFGLVIAVAMLLSAFSLGAVMQQNPELASMTKGAGSGPLTIAFVIYALVIAYPSWLLLRYSSDARQGVLYGEQRALTDAVGKLKSAFKFWGLLTAIIVGFYLISVVGMAIR